MITVTSESDLMSLYNDVRAEFVNELQEFRDALRAAGIYEEVESLLNAGAEAEATALINAKIGG